MNDYPAMIAPVNHVEPVPRRIRAFLGDEKVLDTTRAYVGLERPQTHFFPSDGKRAARSAQEPPKPYEPKEASIRLRLVDPGRCGARNGVAR